MVDKNTAPFVKWAGGKRQLLNIIKEKLPKKYKGYYEPFVGGGAVLFELQPELAVINDINTALVNTYRMIKDECENFISAVHLLDESMWDDGKAYYLSLREQYNRKIEGGEYDIWTAALFVFLNKHCFNGLYRVNRNGQFNVPYNNSRRASIDAENIRAVSEYLKEIWILNGDFEDACKGASAGDFVFLDSPYAPLKADSFEAYTKEGFSVEEHKRLAKLFDELTKRGCFCMLTNHDTEFVRGLYGGKGYKMETVDVKRSINSDASKRTGQEIIICNF